MTIWRSALAIDDLREPLLALGGQARCCAFATLVAVDGPAPRDVGAQMLITGDAYWGFLSGGCIEADVARHARAAMADGAPRMLRYGDGSPWIDIRLACGSGISVLVEPLKTDELAVAELLQAHAARVPIQWSSDGLTRTVVANHSLPGTAWDGTRYTRLFEPTLRLVLIGQDGVTLTSAALARELGWDVVVIAPGGPEAPIGADIAYYSRDALGALAEVGVDRWTAIAVLTHDRDDDERGLAAALMTDAFYVGAIGARARLAARCAKLRGHGLAETDLARLRAPIGLHGFGKAPREVALSLVADVAQAFHARSASARSPGESISSSAPLSSVAIRTV